MENSVTDYQPPWSLVASTKCHRMSHSVTECHTVSHSCPANNVTGVLYRDCFDHSGHSVLHWVTVGLLINDDNELETWKKGFQ